MKFFTWLKSLFTGSDAQYTPEQKAEFLSAARKNGQERRAAELSLLEQAEKEADDLIAKKSVAKLTELEQNMAKQVTAVDVSHLTDEEMEELVEKLNDHSDHLEELLATSGNRTDEENLAELTKASKALEKLLGVKFDSLEDFMTKQSSSQSIPFTTIENFNDAYKELDHFSQSAEIKSDWDILEELIGYHNKGYELDGLMDIYKKMERKDDLTEAERKQMKDWYVLVGAELVYNV